MATDTSELRHAAKADRHWRIPVPELLQELQKVAGLCKAGGNIGICQGADILRALPFVG